MPTLTTLLMATTPAIFPNPSSLSEETRLATAGKEGAAIREEPGMVLSFPNPGLLLFAALVAEREAGKGKQSSSDTSVLNLLTTQNSTWHGSAPDRKKEETNSNIATEPTRIRFPLTLGKS